VGLGLRVLDGINLSDFEKRTGANLLAEFDKQIADLSNRGLVEVVNDRLRVTHRGLLLLNDVAQEFLPEF
jgi:oxygen-independent coproporphyrinogen-3 oxidase